MVLGRPSHEVVRVLPARVPPPREQAASLTMLQPLAEYTVFAAWCAEASGDDGTSPSPQAVMHALVRRLLADPRLGADVLADLREGATASEVDGYVGW